MKVLQVIYRKKLRAIKVIKTHKFRKNMYKLNKKVWLSTHRKWYIIGSLFCNTTKSNYLEYNCK